MKANNEGEHDIEHLLSRVALLKEEIFNSLTHGIAAVLSLVGLVYLVVYAVQMGDPWKIVGFSIYGLCLFSLYFASTLYHAFQHPPHKEFFKLLDHCAIYLLIAGTYTPILLVNLRGTTGWILFAAVWLIAGVGIWLKVAHGNKFRALRVLTYVVMGWLAVFAGSDLITALSNEGFGLILLGGLIYTIGIVFYWRDHVPFNHAIWHLFVIGGSVCHYFAMYFYVLPVV
ncbi:MAG: hemolysin III family protein [Pseudomonadales bacterium]|nr:hemolysin III family protein [Pseudomonadales bacterium]